MKLFKWLVVVWVCWVGQVSAEPTLFLSSPSALDTRDYTLTVQSAYGTPSPAVGSHTYAWQSSVICSVESEVSVDGVVYACSGWSGTGSVPLSGDASNTGPLVLTNVNSSITWNWVESDTDRDGLPDAWEMAYFSDLDEDGFGDFDSDGLSNAAEYAAGTDPTVPNTGIYNTKQEGMNLIRDLQVVGSELRAGHAALALHCFEAAVTSAPNDYEARIYLAALRLLNLVNDADLNDVTNLFGFSLNSMLEPFGEFDSDSAPDIDWAVDSASPNILNALDASLADLNVIPSGWTGTVELSTNDLPLNENVFVDAADVGFMKSALLGARAKILTLRANRLAVDYSTLDHQLDAPIQSMVVDGATNDWDGVAPQLIGGVDSLLHSVRMTRDASAFYLLIDCGEMDLNSWYWMNGNIKLGEDVSVSLVTGDTYDGNAVFRAGTNSYAVLPQKGISEGRWLEIGISIPTEVAVSYAQAESISLNTSAGWDELFMVDYVPAEDLLASQPDCMGPVRSAPDLTAAKGFFIQALDLFLQANQLAEARTDLVMHFVEYDPANSVSRLETVSRIEEVRASMDAPIHLVVTNDLGEAEFEELVHLGAYFSSDYLTRAMLPQFKDVLGQPRLETLPDPTLGGIFSELTLDRAMRYARAVISDQDYDRLPDEWEDQLINAVTDDAIVSIFDVDPAEDFDADGNTNLKEYQQGSDPLRIQLHHFGWGAIVSSQIAGQYFPVTLTALNENDIVVRSYMGPAQLVGRVGGSLQDELIVAAGADNWNYPMATYYHDSRTQVIYLHDEIGEACEITSLALNVGQVPGQMLENWTIRMRHTELEDYSVSQEWESDWTVVYQSNTVISSTGWVVFEFEVPFNYNGIQNLMVDFSYNNLSWTSDGMCQAMQTAASSRSLCNRNDSSYGDPLEWPNVSYPSPNMSSMVPTIKLGLVAGDPVTIFPTNSGQFVSGIWDGAVAVADIATNMVLRAYDALGIKGVSEPFSVLDGIVNEDVDADGLQDVWEVVHFRSLSPSADDDMDEDGLTNAEESSSGSNPMRSDSDDDGVNDWNEWVAGTSLTNSASLLDVECEIQSDGSRIISWHGVSGRFYTFEYRDSLTQPWQSYPFEVPGSGAPLLFMDSQTGNSRYYRVKVRKE